MHLLQGDSAPLITGLSERWDLVFVDGDHTYAGMMRDLAALAGRVLDGGTIMCHDYFDARNNDPDNHDYGVRQAVDELAPTMGLLFRGGFGAIALFEHPTEGE